VNNEQAWTDDPAELLRRRVLRLMADDVVEQGALIAERLGEDPKDVGHAWDVLAGNHLVRAFEPSLAETYTTQAMRTPAGRALVSRWDAQSGVGNLKRSCSAALLAWLGALDGQDVGSTDEFTGDVRAFHFGVAYESELVAKAARDLKSLGLIEGTATWGGPIVRPAITPLGQLVASRHGGDVLAWQMSRGAETTVHVTGSTGVVVAANSPNAQQSVTVTATIAEQVLNLAAALEAMIPVLQLEGADEAQARGLALELKQAAPEASSNPARTSRLVAAVRDIAVNAAGGAAGSALVALASQVAANL
jgi:hypothetical protein